MKKTFNTLLYLIIPVVLVAAGMFYVFGASLNEQQKDAVYPSHKVTSISPTLVDAAISFKGEPYEIGDAHAVIVPHHDIASSLIAKTFAGVSYQPDVVIVLAPDHEEVSTGFASTGTVIWQNVIKPTYPHERLVKEVVKPGLVNFHNSVIVEEHAVSVLQPFIAHYFPQATVVPIILKNNQSEESLDHIVAFLEKAMQEHNALVVGSVDFSHYVNVEQALQRDEITKKAIVEHDYDALQGFNHEYLDSPATVVAILMAFGDATLHAQHDATEFLHQDPTITSVTTSYLIYSVD
jgi:AmmeMemoRadiSam system protein B